MILKAQNISWKAGGKTIVDDVSFSVKKGEFFGLIGPNGSGKTSILSLLAGLHLPSSGEIYLNDEPLSHLKRRDIARKLAFVEQHSDTDTYISATDVVALGRTPHLSPLRPYSQEDGRITKAAIEKVNMSGFADRIWNTLSGGEKQRLHFARALAQEPELIILDEPTNHLDIQHQLTLLHLVRSLDLTVVAALHDLNCAALFCDRIAVIDHGGIVAIGSPRDVLTNERIFDVFHINAEVDIDKNGVLHIRYSYPKNSF